MTSHAAASQAYAAAATHRSLRAQEAEVFSRATAALRDADAGGSETDRARALADNERLWLTVVALLRDPANALPAGLRASMVSVGLAVQREMRGPSPDMSFLIAVNDQFAAGLAAAA